MKRIFIFILFIVIANSALAQRKILTKNNKFGASRIAFVDALYTVRSDNVEYSAVKPLTGIVLFYEHIFGDYFSFGLQYGNGMSRNVEETAGETVVNIQESANYTAYDLKAYFSSNVRGGIKLYVGAGQGSLNATSDISTRNRTGVTTTEETETTVPITFGNIGIDMFSSPSSAGFRLEVGYVSAEKAETIGTTQAIYNFSGSTYSFAIFYRF